jgi:hypothetical protein
VSGEIHKLPPRCAHCGVAVTNAHPEVIARKLPVLCDRGTYDGRRDGCYERTERARDFVDGQEAA